MVTIEHLSYAWGDRPVLDDVTSEFATGTVTTLTGPNGAGKTTLLGCIAGLLDPRAGIVRSEATSAHPGDDDWKRVVGLSPDQGGILDDLSPAEQLELCATLFGFDQRESLARSETLLAAFELDDHRDSPAGTLSSGMRKRLSCALALVHGPRIVLLDEPLNGLDARGGARLLETLKVLRASNRTIILSSHDVAFFSGVADRVVRLADGRLEEATGGSGGTVVEQTVSLPWFTA